MRISALAQEVKFLPLASGGTAAQQLSPEAATAHPGRCAGPNGSRMPVEIERRFLVADDGWRPLSRSSQSFCQGYLALGPGPTVRVRRAGSAAFVTIKGDGQVALPEFEYAIPVADAEAMLAGLCHRPLVEKTRHDVWHAGVLWHVDEFRGGNDGLVLAEAESRRLARWR